LSDKIRLGLVGCGAWGRNYIETIKSIPSTWLTTICDPILSRIPESVYHDTEITTDYRAITADQVDKVIIATPPSTHREIATYFLKAEIPVLLEKPVAETLRDAESIFNIAVQKNTTILVNNIHLFAPAYTKLREIVSSWKRPFIIESIGMNRGPFRDYSSLLDYGPHDLSMCLGITNSYPDSVYIYKEEKNPGEIHTIYLEFDKIRATIMIGNGHYCKKRKFVVCSQSDTVTYDDSLKLNNATILVSSSPPLLEIVNSFISSNIDWRHDPELNLNIMRILSHDVFRR
jgi:predicted dehydrogenase